MASGPSEAAGFAEGLLQVGFLDPTIVPGLIRGWRGLLALLGAELVVCDYAPTATLALRGLPLPRVLVGTGFGLPPACEPMPPYRWWQPAPARLQDAERRVLAVANEALRVLRAPPLTRLADMLEADRRFLCTFPELDHFPERGEADYVGSIFQSGAGVAPAWPSAEGRRVFVYLKPAAAGFDDLLPALREVDANVLVHAPRVPESMARAHASARLAFSDELVDMAAVREQCDACVCHAGMGTTSAVLLAGAGGAAAAPGAGHDPRRVEGMGAGIAVLPAAAQRRPDCARLLRRLLDEPQYVAGAAAFAARHRGFDQARAARRIAEGCAALVVEDTDGGLTAAR